MGHSSVNSDSGEITLFACSFGIDCQKARSKKKNRIKGPVDVTSNMLKFLKSTFLPRNSKVANKCKKLFVKLLVHHDGHSIQIDLEANDA